MADPESVQYNSQEEFDKALEESGYGRYFCRKCSGKFILTQGSERQSMRVYAGMYCENCWKHSGYITDREFDPMDAGERLEEDDP